MSRFIAALLCAGWGTRMGALTRETPKQLLPVADRPILDYLLEQLADLPGLDEVHVVTNTRYFPRFVAWSEGWRERGIPIRLHDDGSSSTDEMLGSVGDLGFLLSRVDGDPGGALVAGTDNVFRFSLRPLWDEFLARRGNVVLALPEDDPDELRRSGVLELGPDDEVLRIHEKPDEPPSRWACPSLYCLTGGAIAGVRDYLGEGGAPDDLGRFLGWLLERETIRAHRREGGRRLHVGSPAAWREADAILRREPVLRP